jgi:hypothetical protein
MFLSSEEARIASGRAMTGTMTSHITTIVREQAVAPFASDLPAEMTLARYRRARRPEPRAKRRRMTVFGRPPEA